MVDQQWAVKFRSLAETESRVAYAMSTINGRTILPDKTIVMFELGDLEYLDTILDKFDRVDFEACYCSIFDECWTMKMTTYGASEPVESCARADSSFIE